MSRRTILTLNLIALAIYLLVGWSGGLLAHIQASVFSSPDSREYREVADWIFGSRSSSVASGWRPFLYPVLLGAAERIGGVYGVWLLNVAMWFATLNLTAAATHRFVESKKGAVAVFLILATNLSLIVLSFEGLTELTTAALLALWAFGLARFQRRPTAAQVVLAVLPVSLLVVVKPEFEVLLLVVVIAMIIVLVRTRATLRSGAALGVCLSPVAFQIALMVRFHGYWGVSNIGEQALDLYYLPRLAVATGQSPSFQAARAQLAGASLADAGHLVAAHPVAALGVFGGIVQENLLSGTNFLFDRPLIEFAILATQVIYFVVLLAMIPVVAAALWRKRDLRLAFLCAGLLTILGAAGLSFWAGDRYTVIALPLWSVALTMAVRQIGYFPRLKSSPARASKLAGPDTPPA